MRNPFLWIFLIAAVLTTGSRFAGIQAEEIPGADSPIKAVYPAQTIIIQPAFSAGILLPLSGSDAGGEILMGIDVFNLLDRVSFGISGDYHYLPDSAGDPVHFSRLGARAGYRFNLLNLLGITPQAGFSFLRPYNSDDNSIVPGITAGFGLDVHLADRNFLVLTASLVYPFRSELSPCLSLRLGMKKSHPVMIAVPPVGLSLSILPERFSPDKDGENDLMEIRLDVKNKKSVKKWRIMISDDQGGLVFSWSGRGEPPDRTEWDGYSSRGELISSASDYFIRAETEDRLGNIHEKTGTFLSDILVEKENDKYKIRIPGILFPPNSADTALLSLEDLEKNREIIQLIALRLGRFPEYSIRIEGHGNIEAWENAALAEKEQREVLIPLTRARAQAVKEALVALGLREDRISVLGLGGSDPLVPFSDAENWWKNRRVEFILVK